MMKLTYWVMVPELMVGKIYPTINLIRLFLYDDTFNIFVRFKKNRVSDEDSVPVKCIKATPPLPRPNGLGCCPFLGGGSVVVIVVDCLSNCGIL